MVIMVVRCRVRPWISVSSPGVRGGGGRGTVKVTSSRNQPPA